ncbi:MAG TPA: hypothetical protein VK530_01965 [Candidatus Acidoferrum sp.]|nr:hypothetical protein [Candidatus Acidoferrum sp.]
MKRKWIVLLAALFVLAVVIGVAIRPQRSTVTLHYLGRNPAGAHVFMVTNHSARVYYCAGMRVSTNGFDPQRSRVWISSQPAGPLAAHRSIQFQYPGLFDPQSNDAVVLCRQEAGLISRVRLWARGAGLRWPAVFAGLKPPMRDPQTIQVHLSNSVPAVAKQEGR